jgi:ABC-type antimicrobial peptide transport system permease subunit
MLTFRITFPRIGYTKDYQRHNFLRLLTEHINRLGKVTAVSLCSSLPPNPLGLAVFETQGLRPTKGLPPMVSFQVIRSNYFRVMRTPIIAGRGLTPADDERATNSAVVNSALVDRYFGHEGAALGRRITLPGLTNLKIVGVFADVRNAGLAQGPEPEVYVGMGQTTTPTATFVVETNLRNPLALTKSIERLVRSIDSEQAVADIQTMGQRLTATVASLRFAVLLTVLFGTIAAVLSVIGIYGVSSYSTESGSRDIAVRLAFGASRMQVVVPILREMVLMSAIGAAAAAALTLSTRHVLAEVLNQAVTNSGTALIGVSTATAGVACVAAYLPVHRILAVDPLRTLRQ